MSITSLLWTRATAADQFVSQFADNRFMKELAKMPASSRDIQQMPTTEESKKDL